MRTILICLLAALGNLCHIRAQEVSFRKYNQTTKNYEARQNFPADGVADDFGPRDLGDDWHGGTDYNASKNDGNADKGYMLVAPEAGTFPNANNIIRIDKKPRYMILDVGDYRYCFLHMFDNNYDTEKDGWDQQWFNDSTIYLSRLIGLPNSWGMVMLIDGDTIAIGQQNGKKILYKNKELAVSNSVSQYGPIGQLGVSGKIKVNGKSEDYKAHLHLCTVPDDKDYADDPINGNALQYVNYTKPTYDIGIISELSTSGVGLRYPGTQPTKLRVRVGLQGEQPKANRYNSIMDANTIEFMVKPNRSSTYLRIKGNTTEGKISLGGRLGENIVNHDPWRYVYPGQYHLWKKTGIHSNAYNSINTSVYGGNPWDDYYFIDFPTRIHSDDPLTNKTLQIADFPSAARYNDGKYSFRARVIDIRNAFSDRTTEFTLDNFLPFVESARISIAALSTLPPVIIARHTWGGHDANKTKAGDGYMSQVQVYGKACGVGLGYVTIECTSSEPMQWMKAKLVGAAGNPEVSGVSSDGVGWAFAFGNIGISAQEYTVEFTGRDDSGNDLFNTRTQQSNGRFIVPARQASGWLPQPVSSGKDDYFKFKPLCEQPKLRETRGIVVTCEDCISPDRVTIKPYRATSGNNGHIDLTINALTAITSITWTNEQGTVIGNTEDIANLAPGLYCVKIEDEFCCTVSMCATIDDCGNVIQAVTIDPPCLWPSARTVTLELADPGSVTSIDWSNPAGTDGSPTTLLPSGHHTVTVTDNAGCTDVKAFDLTVRDIASQTIATVTPVCGSDKNTIRIVLPADIIPQNGWTWYWSFEGEDLNLPEATQFTADYPGSYTLTISSADGCEYTKTVIAPPFSLQPGIAIKSVKNIDYCLGSQPNCKGRIEAVVINNPDNVAITSVKWGGPNGNLPTTGLTAANLCEGGYTLEVFFANGCSRTLFQSICCCKCDDPVLAAGHAANTGSDTTRRAEVDCKLRLCNKNGDGSSDFTVRVDIVPINHDGVGSILPLITGGDIHQFRYLWSGPNGFAATSSKLTNIPPGEYCVTITNGCGEFTGCYDLCPFGFDVDINYGCAQTDITLTPYPDADPARYTFSWSRGGSTTNTTTVNATTALAVTVTRIGAGCKIIQNMDILQKGVTVTPVPSCGDYVPGQIIVNINNPAQEPVNVEIANAGIKDFSITNKKLELVFPDLVPGQSYPYKIKIGSCDYTGSVFVYKGNTELRYSYHEGEACYFDELCNGQVVAYNSVKETEHIRYDLAETCWVPAYCGDVDVAHRDRDTRTCPFFEYEYIVNHFWQYGYTGVNKTTADLEIIAWHPDCCDRVRYCTADLNIKSINRIPDCSRITQLEDGCFEVDCTALFFDFTFCPEDGEHAEEPYYEKISCVPRQLSVYQMLNWMSWLYANRPAFAGSTLEQFLLQVSADPDKLEKSKCANVSFCATNFKFLYSDINTVTCTQQSATEFTTLWVFSAIYGDYIEVYVPNIDHSCDVIEEDPNGDYIVVNCFNPNGANGEKMYQKLMYLTPPPNGFFPLLAPPPVESRSADVKQGVHISRAGTGGKFYPNPFTNSISVYWDFDDEAAHAIGLELYDALGRRVYGRTFSRYDLQANTLYVSVPGGLAPGLYFCRLSIDGAPVRTERLIKM